MYTNQEIYERCRELDEGSGEDAATQFMLSIGYARYLEYVNWMITEIYEFEDVEEAPLVVKQFLDWWTENEGILA